MKSFITIIIFFLTTNAFGSASNVYISQNGGGTGFDNTKKCASSLPVSFFNNSNNWGANTNQIGAGSIVHLCGTFNMPANTNVIKFHGGGTSSAKITLLFESGASMTSPAFPYRDGGGAINTGGFSYLVIDGGVNGVIQNTANGSGKTYHQGSTAIAANSSTNVEVKNLKFANLYIHVSPDTGISGDSVNCVYNHGLASGWSIHDNTANDASWCFELQYDNGLSSNINIYRNNIYNVDHGIALGGPNPGNSLKNVNIYSNHIHDYANWDTPISGPCGPNNACYHHDGIHIWGDGNNGSDIISNINIYDNTFDGNMGQAATAHIFVETNSGGTSNVQIYNNVLIDTGVGPVHNGLIAVGKDGPFAFYNNTMIGAPNDVCYGLPWSKNIVFENNIAANCNQLMYTSTASFASLNNNVYANGGNNSFVCNGTYMNFSSIASWRTCAKGDLDSKAVPSAGLSSSGVPQSGAAGNGKGLNLTSLNIPTLNSDIHGSVRKVAWDIGAYMYGGTIPNPTPNPGPTPTPTPNPTPSGSSKFVSFTLMDAALGKPVAGFDPIPSGGTIILNNVPKALSVRANTSGTVGSASLQIDSNSAHLESSAPFSLCGDNGATYTNCSALSVIGSHTLKGIPYPQAGGAGTPGATLSLTFKVVQSSSSIAVTNISLVDAATGTAISGFNPLISGAAISLSKFAGKKFNIVATVSGSPTSVSFSLDSVVHSESSAPFYACGDAPISCSQLSNIGNHSLTVTPAGGSGKVISFSIIK